MEVVADSDEEEQEMLDAQAQEDEKVVRQALETAGTTKLPSIIEREEGLEKQEQEQHVVWIDKPQTGRDAQEEIHLEQREAIKEVTDDQGDDKDEELQVEQDEKQTDDVLEVGTVVEVESRTWPGINKQGGAGRITRIHRELVEGEEAEAIFYDVRYVLGGFERHIEQEYVHSSKLLKKHSNREKVSREYYHDDYINEPHLRKQREAEKNREKVMAGVKRVETHVLHSRKRKRSHKWTRGEQISKKLEDDVLSSDDAMIEENEVMKISDDAFIFPERSRRLQTEASQAHSDASDSPVKQSVVLQRRRHQITDSSDEERSRSGDIGDFSSLSSDQFENLESYGAESLFTKDNARDYRRNEDRHRKRKEKNATDTRRRFVGGYEHNDDDADGKFIQPEGNPDELPNDVIRVTGLRLETTTDGLMKQLKEVFVQQQKNIAAFHIEQKRMDSKMTNLLEMPLSDLQDLYRMIVDLEENFLTKTLVNAGEDAMDTICRKLEHFDKLPAAFEQLDRDIDDWKEELKECSQWVHGVRDAMEDALSQRNAHESLRQVVLAEHSSDSSYFVDDNDASNFSGDSAGGDDATSNVNLSIGFEFERIDSTKKQERQHVSVSKVEARRRIALKAGKRNRGNWTGASPTLDDFFLRQKSSNRFTSNIRLPGNQKKKLLSDSRWAWVKIARKKQQQARKENRDHSLRSSLLGYSGKHASVYGVRPTNGPSRNDNTSVQAQRMHLRNERIRALPKQWESRGSYFSQTASPKGRNSHAYPTGISFDNFSLKKSLQSAKAANTTIHPSGSTQQGVNWETIFEVVVDDPSTLADEHGCGAISREGQEALMAFGHRICRLSAPHHLPFDEDWDFEVSKSFEAAISRRTARLRQLLSDLRLQESIFMDLLSAGDLDATDEEEYANSPQWTTLVALEAAYHRAIASLVAQSVQALKGFSPLDFSSCLTIIWEQIVMLVRQLPDCNALFDGCKAYFFFFEVASRDASTTPLLTAVLRTYWYCLDILTALRSMADCLTGQLVTIKQKVKDVFRRVPPINRIVLAVVLFLFDLYIYLPASHRVEDKGGVNVMLNEPSPALSLWMLVRDCSKLPAEIDQPEPILLSTKEKHVWALLQAVYRQRYCDEVARHFVRSESCGGYLRDFEPSAADGSNSKVCEEIFESQLLSLETMWNLVATLSHIYAKFDDDGHEEAVCDAKWAVVKDLLQPGNPDFLPFNFACNPSLFLHFDYCRSASIYKQYVLRRVTKFSKQWRPCKEIVKHILCEIWRSDGPCHSNDVVRLPRLFKHYTGRCRELGNSVPRLIAFVETDDADEDSTTALCKIVWIQLLKLEKRVHRSRFRRSVLSAIPETLGSSPSTSVEMAAPDWCWGSKDDVTVHKQSSKLPEVSKSLSSTSTGLEKERISIAVLLVFAVVGVCLECGDELRFPDERTDKDIKYMEREVNFYCKEILRWTSEKPGCDVLAAQALFTLGALLLEKNSSEFPIVFWALNDKFESSLKKLQGESLAYVSSTPQQSLTTKSYSMSTRQQHSRGAAMSSLYHMRDLVRKMLEMPSSGMKVGAAFRRAVLKSLEHVFSTGMESCLNFATQGVVVVNDLNIALDIFQLLLPRAPDVPNQCCTLSSSPDAFENDFDDALAMLDIDEMLVGRNSGPPLAWTIMECRSQVIQLITSNLRVAVQHLVLHYPSTATPTFEELYAIDLLGLMISTCDVQFFWSNLTSASARSRNLAPRILSAALKYDADKKWLKNAFLRESGADQSLSIAWLLGTLDVAAIKPTPIFFEWKDIPYSMVKATTPEGRIQDQIRVYDSDYWIMLTDGILYNLLCNDSDGFEAMNPHVLKLLREVASTCKFCTTLRANNKEIHDTATLYDLRLEVFRSFCQSAGNIWSSYTASHSNTWHEMNQFRAKMVHPSSGVFVSFLEAYKLNFRRACREIDHYNHNWHKFAKLFLRQAGENLQGARTYHDLDDSIKAFDERLMALTTMFQFMYQCLDAFLFHCGEMAIGETNLYFDAMELFFRQVSSAEYPQAIKRLEDQRRQFQREGGRTVNDELRKGFCSASMRFVDSVQLFFALQKYPSLLHWFAQTSEIYQTFKTGWLFSPLRTLLVNILDPDGPLGIHSYYPDDETSDDPNLKFNVEIIRREAFYLSCGVFNCKCTRSFEHSRVEAVSTSCERLQQLRQFVLDNFMRETLIFVLNDNASLLLETMVPLSQFVRAILNHANLNADRIRAAQASDSSTEDDVSCFDFQLNELFSFLEWMVECMIKVIPGKEATTNAICCVMLIELCGITGEAITYNDKRPMLELINLMELVLSYLQTIYLAISRSTTTIATLFVGDVPCLLSEKLSAYQFSTSAFRDIAIEEHIHQVLGRQYDSYGISLARATTDLLAAIERVVQHCKESSDERLLSLTTNVP